MNRPLTGPPAIDPFAKDGAGSFHIATPDSGAGDSTRPGGQLKDAVVKFPVPRDGLGEARDGAPRPPIGQIMVAARRISATDVARVLKFAAKSKLRFGEAAVRLKLIERRDVEIALAHQFSLPRVNVGETAVSPQS